MADGDVAQLGERCPYKAEVVGSSPAVPTTPPAPEPWVFRGYHRLSMCRSAATLVSGSVPRYGTGGR